MLPQIRPIKNKSAKRVEKNSPKPDLRSKHSILLKPSPRYFVISPFIPKNLVFLTNPKRKEKSPLRVVEAYNKEKPNEEVDSLNDFKYFKSLKPKELNFVNPNKVQVKYFEQLGRLKNFGEEKSKMNSNRGMVKKNLSSLTPKPENKGLKDSFGDSSYDFDYLNIYTEF